jgi:hypothetical protein
MGLPLARNPARPQHIEKGGLTMIRKAFFPGCYIQGEDILRNLGKIEELKKKKVFILAANTAVKKIIPVNIWQNSKDCLRNRGF